jgi:two-component system, chemotaxis family, sensor kinase Cph1
MDGTVRTIVADEDKFLRIVQNLLFNAIKFTPPGGAITVIVRAADRDGVPGAGTGNDLHVTVSDTGVGIAPADQERIFEPFQQVESTEARQYHGTGIGLTVVRQLVELHGGRIWLESSPGQGSSFHFVLPDSLSRSEVQEVETAGAGPLQPAEAAEERPTILVVDDIPAHMSVMRLAVTSRGYQMHGVGTGAEAMAWLEHHRPGVIILDMQLPDTDGFSLAAEIRSRVETHALPIIAVSADALSINEERAKASGCDAFLTKPIDIAQLLLTIEAVTV